MGGGGCNCVKKGQKFLNEINTSIFLLSLSQHFFLCVRMIVFYYFVKDRLLIYSSATTPVRVSIKRVILTLSESHGSLTYHRLGPMHMTSW